MAKHFKEDKTDTTAVMSTQRRRGRGRLGKREAQESLPYGQAASYRGSYADAAPTENYFLDDMPKRGGLHALGRGLLLLVAWALRLCALAFVALVVANSLSVLAKVPQLVWVTDTVSSYLPWESAGLLSQDTPLGGVFRGDLALVAIGLFVLDWLVCRLRARLR